MLDFTGAWEEVSGLLNAKRSVAEEIAWLPVGCKQPVPVLHTFL